MCLGRPRCRTITDTLFEPTSAPGRCRLAIMSPRTGDRPGLRISLSFGATYMYAFAAARQLAVIPGITLPVDFGGSAHVPACLLLNGLALPGQASPRREYHPRISATMMPS